MQLVTLPLADGSDVIVNAHKIRLMRTAGGDAPQTIIYFQKEHYLIVSGTPDQVADQINSQCR